MVSTHYMDEAERCHALAILDRGRVVAEGSPRALMASLDAVVVEVESSRLRDARACMASVDGLLSIAQLGSRLRVMVSREIEEPEQVLRASFATAGVEATVERTRPSLEDVFVGATQKRAQDA